MKSGLGELIGILGEANRLANSCQLLFARFRERTGLTGVEVMTLIGITDVETPPTVPQVGRTLGHPRQVIQRAVRTLEAAGFVQLLPNPGHKRASLLVPTEAGLALGAAIDAETAAIVAELAEPLDLGMLTSTNSALRAVRDGMDRYISAQPDPGD